MEKFITNNLETIIGSLTAIIGFFTGWKMKKANERKADAEADAKHIENLDKIFKIQKQQVDELVADFKAEKERIKEMVNELKLENENLKNLLSDKQHIINEQKIIIEKYKVMVIEQKETIRKLSKSLDYYKKKYGNEKN